MRLFPHDLHTEQTALQSSLLAIPAMQRYIIPISKQMSTSDWCSIILKLLPPNTNILPIYRFAIQNNFFDLSFYAHFP
jgi:hypothetical protein